MSLSVSVNTRTGKRSVKHIPSSGDVPSRYVHMIPLLNKYEELTGYSVVECRLEDGKYLYKDVRQNGSVHEIWFQSLTEFVEWHCKREGVSAVDYEVMVPHRYM